MLQTRLSSSFDLERAGERIVRHLGGHWRGNGGMCLCPAHDDHSPSLSVRVGRSALLFKCFAGSDTIDVINALRELQLRPLSSSPSTHAVRSYAPTESWLRQRVQDLWYDCRPLHGTIAETYLRRQLLLPQSRALRYHARTPLGPRQHVQFRPALIAAMHDDERLLPVQRTFLGCATASLTSDLQKARWTLGRPLNGAVRLARSKDVLGLAEGGETALAAMSLLDMPVWATLGSERFPQVANPETVRRLILLPDNDHAGAAAASQAHARPERIIKTIWPPLGLTDWNDVLRMGRTAAGAGCVGQFDDTMPLRCHRGYRSYLMYAILRSAEPGDEYG